MQRKEFPAKKYRLFWGLAVSDVIADKLKKILCDRYPELKNADWTASGNYHITIRFLGDVLQDQLQQIMSNVANLSLERVPFSASIKTLSRFPTDEGKIIVANISLSEPLATLYRFVKEAMAPILLFQDSYPFRPHMTLCRMSYERCKRFNAIDLECEVSFDQLILFQSRKVSRGSVYLPLYRLLLS